jgi:DNA-binding NarL/FixJ family response regulator
MNVNLKAHKFLLIEDYSTMRSSIKDMLFSGGAQQITEAENAKAALQAMEKQKFDIVLCDYNLGAGKNGQQLLEEAKYRQLLPHNAIFIMVTAEQAASMVLSSIDNKPDEYLAKPFNQQQLLGRIEKQILRKAYFADIDAAIHNDDLPLAIAHCERLLAQRDPKMRTQLLKIGAELAIGVGSFKTAQQYYQEVLLQRDLAWAKHGLGVIAYLQNQYAAAVELFKDVLSKAPMMLETYDWLAKAHEALEQHEEAQASLQQAVAISSEAILRQQRLAVLSEHIGNDEAAVKAYKSAIKLGQYSVHKSSHDFAGLAKLYSKTNNNLQALKLVKEMRESFQKSPEAELRAACLETAIYLKQGDQPLIDKAYAKLQPITHQHHYIPKDLLLDIAETHWLMGNTEASNQLIIDLIGNNVDDERFIQALVHRHQTFSQDDVYANEAVQTAKQALIELNNRGVSLFKQGQMTGALELLEAAHKKTPNNKFILMNLVKILLQDIKNTGFSKAKHLRIHAYILKATALKVPQDKIGNIKMELSKLSSN